MVKPIRVLIAFAALAALSACSWDLSDKDSDLSDVKVTTKTETAPTVERVSTYRNETLSSYTVRYISDQTTRAVDQEQSYSATGSLISAWTYHRNSDGRVDLAAYSGPDGAIKYYYVYAYDGSGSVITQGEYDASNNLEWLRRYSTKASGTAAGQLETAASYTGASLVLSGGLKYYFIEGSYPSKTWNMEVAYGTDSSYLSGGVKVDDPTACPATLASLSVEDRLSVTLPSVPSLPAPSIPSDFAAVGLSVDGYRFSFDDAYGNTTVKLDKAWYPLSGTRSDSRLSKAVSVNLAHDAQGRVTEKTIKYGTTVALQVGVVYESGSSLFPTRVSTSGTSMLLPLDYELTYGSRHEVSEVSVKSNGVLLRRFAYAYTTTPSADVTVPALRGMDPFAFMSGLLKMGLVISEYDGDGKLVETFTASSSGSSCSIAVNKPTADGKPGGDLNGSYEVSFDAAGNPVSLAAKATNGVVSWSQNLASFASRWADLESAAPAAFDEAIPYGSMVESFIAPSDAQTVSKIQESFVYSLLF